MCRCGFFNSESYLNVDMTLACPVHDCCGLWSDLAWASCDGDGMWRESLPRRLNPVYSSAVVLLMEAHKRIAADAYVTTLSYRAVNLWGGDIMEIFGSRQTSKLEPFSWEPSYTYIHTIKDLIFNPVLKLTLWKWSKANLFATHAVVPPDFSMYL